MKKKYAVHILTSLFFPFLQKISPDVLPKRGLKKLENGWWEATDNDPQFIVRTFLLKILSGWISIKIKIDSPKVIMPKLYFDFGEGYSESRAIDLRLIGENTYQAEIVMPSTLKNIRFDPDDNSGTFSLQMFQIKAHSEILHTVHQFLSIMKHDARNRVDPLRIFKKSYARYKKHNFRGMIERLENEYKLLYPCSVQRCDPQYIIYLNWIKENEKNKNEVFNENTFDYTPLVSVIMTTYNTPIQYLKKAIDSVLNQSYPYWELCIADNASDNEEVLCILAEYMKKEKRINVYFSESNDDISLVSNAALALAKGNYVAFMDHDDMLAINALLEVVKTVNSYPNAKLIYSDEDKIDEKDRRYDPHFKPDWNPDMFYSHNYISHFNIIKKSLVEEVGMFREGYEGAQDYDLLLRVICGLKADEIAHVAKVLYHQRNLLTSKDLSEKQDNITLKGIKALQEYFDKKESGIVVIEGLMPNTYKAIYPVPGIMIQDQLAPYIKESKINQAIFGKLGAETKNPKSTMELPLVTLLIPTRDGYDILSKCVKSILEKTTYPNYEIIILDNETTDKRTLDYFDELKSYSNISILEYHHPFNYSAINNFGIRYAKGEIIGLINNDVEVISDHWLTEMVQHALRSEIGAVGAMLYYGNDSIQHAGVVLGIGGVAGHSHKHFKRGSSGYFSRLKIIQNYSAVTAACLIVRKELYLKVGGLEEKHLKVAFNDVDLCLKFQQQGYRNLWTPYVELYHHESISRGAEDTDEKKIRAAKEVLYLQQTWPNEIKVDKCYNINLTNKYENFGIKDNNSR